MLGGYALREQKLIEFGAAVLFKAYHKGFAMLLYKLYLALRFKKRTQLFGLLYFQFKNIRFTQNIINLAINQFFPVF